MAHTVSYNPDAQIIEVKMQGSFTKSETKEIISQVIETAIEKKCFLCLSDYREAVLDMSIFEIFEVPQKISKIIAPYGIHAAKIKRAVVVANNLKEFRFFETVTLNSGQNMKLFQNIDQAKDWLLQK